MIPLIGPADKSRPPTMEERQKPTVMIRTYSSYNSVINTSSPPQQQQQQQQAETATKSERSTDLFINQKSRSQTHRPANRIFRYLHQIKGPSGSIRGHRDVVRKSLENIKVAAASGHRDFSSSNLTTFKSTGNNLTIKQLDELYRLDYLAKLVEEEQNKCVAYTTTLGVVRRTFEDSKLMKSILSLNLICYEERDIYLNQEYKYQLRMRCKSITVPALFVGGQHLGGIKELEIMNENGRLSVLLANYKMPKAQKGVCFCCGNAKFIACQSCNGSRKSAVHHFKFNSIALRCIKCVKNDGLVQCPICMTANGETGYCIDKIHMGEEKDDNNNTTVETDETNTISVVSHI